MTRWFLTNLPIRVGQERRARYRVLSVYFDWERGVLDLLQVSGLLGGFSGLAFGPGIEIREREVWVSERRLVERLGRRRCADCRVRDWEGRLVEDSSGRVVGRVNDVEFAVEDGGVRGLWVSRGILADVWQGMWLLPYDRLRPSGSRIAVR